MNRAETFDDVSTLLFFIPFAVPGVYALYLWAQRGLSLNLPSDIYLTVTRDPTVFLIGLFAVFAAVLIEVWITDVPKRRERLTSLSGSLQKLAAASFVLALISAFYANGTNVSAAFLDFEVGRYALVFPALLVLLSYLIVTPISTGSLGKRQFVGIVVLFLSAGVMYEVGKRNSLAGISAGFVLIVVGLLIIQLKNPKEPAEEE
jgi:hypothetical protein